MLQAVIWDMDGVIVDSGPIHLAAWGRLFAELGSTATSEDIRHYHGRRTDDAIRGTRLPLLDTLPRRDVGCLRGSGQRLARSAGASAG